eukprot:924050-Pyramimonas_sp.AAC.1
MEAELEAGSSIPADLAELEELIYELCAHASVLAQRRILSPSNLFSDLRPASEWDSAGAEYARSQKVRELARRLALETIAREKVQRASRVRAGPGPR